MKTTFAILILSASLIGCTTTSTIGWDEPSPLHTLNARATTQTALITLANLHQVRARNLHMAADSTSWFDPQSGKLMITATENVVEVTFTSRGRGALDGAGLGIAIGGVSMAAFSAATWSPCRSTGFMSCLMHPENRRVAAVWGAAGGSILGLPVGTVWGAISGRKNTFAIETPAAHPSIGREM